MDIKETLKTPHHIFFNKYKKTIYIFLYALIFIAYAFIILTDFFRILNNASTVINSVDLNQFWNSVEHFLSFDVMYKDYFFNYGIFFLFLQSIGYLIFGHNFLAIIISNYIFLPVIGIIVSYFIGKLILRKDSLVLLFLFFLLLFGVNDQLTSIRHLSAELSLAFFIFYFYQKKSLWLFVSGIIGGIAMLTSMEYAIALNAAILIILFFNIWSDNKKLGTIYVTKFLLGEMVIFIPYSLLLFLQGTFMEFWKYFLNTASLFYYAGPGSGASFARFSELRFHDNYNLEIFNIPLEFISRLNLYIIFIFFIIYFATSITISIKSRKISQKNLIKIFLIIFGLLVYFRTLQNPEISIFTYGLVPFFLLLTITIYDFYFLLQRSKNKSFKFFGYLGIFIIVLWFIISENTGYIAKIFDYNPYRILPQFSKTTKSYSPSLAYYLDKNVKDKFEETIDYIIKNSDAKDFVYEYPWGIINQVARRKSPIIFDNPIYFYIDNYGEKFINQALVQIKNNPPKFIVINISIKDKMFCCIASTTTDKLDAGYFSSNEKNSPIFTGDGNKIEKFILENYTPVYYNDRAIIMAPKAQPANIQNREIISEITDFNQNNIALKLLEKNDGNSYSIKGSRASWTMTLEKPISNVSDVILKLKLDDSIFKKYFVKYRWNIHIETDNKKNPIYLKYDLVNINKTQEIKALFPEPRKIKKVTVELEKNMGFAWWLYPENINIEKISFRKILFGNNL